MSNAREGRLISHGIMFFSHNKTAAAGLSVTKTISQTTPKVYSTGQLKSITTEQRFRKKRKYPNDYYGRVRMYYRVQII